MAVSTGKLRMAAAILGLMRYRSGLIRMVARASTCSEERWIPISAVMAEPALAVIMIAARTGPNSLMRDRKYFLFLGRVATITNVTVLYRKEGLSMLRQAFLLHHRILCHMLRQMPRET